MFIRLLALSVLLTACGAVIGPSPTSQGVTSTSASPTKNEGDTSGRFDGLTITLQLKAASVPSGGQIGSVLTVRNDSGETVVDPSCLIGSGRYALLPVSDPDAELWLQPVMDCSGDFKMADGFVAHYSGPTFPARAKHGDALPPGDYIATLEIDGYSERLEQLVEITE